MHQKKNYLSVFTISLSQTLFLSFKTLRFLVFIPVLFLSAFIKSASSLRKNLVFHSMYEVWPWSCLDPGTATDHLQLCCREHKGHFCKLSPCRQGIRTYRCSCFWFFAQNILQFSKVPWFKKKKKLSLYLCLTESMGFKHVLNLNHVLEYSPELGLLQGHNYQGTCSFAFLHAALHILLMEQSVTH